MWCKTLSRHDAFPRQQVALEMLFVSIQELEAAINYWRSQSPAVGEELRLCPEAAALAKPYALMIVQGALRIPMDVLDETEKRSILDFLKSTQKT